MSDRKGWIRNAGVLAVLALLAACGLQPVTTPDAGAGPDDDGAADSGEVADATPDVPAAPGTDVATAEDIAGPDDTVAAEDTAPAGCEPACPPWQVCTDGACATKACAADAECNGPGLEPHYCFQGKCALFQCAKDADCKAGQKCNTLSYLCYTPATGCTYDAMCVDQDACTDDTCDKATGQCLHELTFGCCKTAADCDDGAACTTDTCTGGKCDWVSKADCCTVNAECADSSPCTADTCQGGKCVFTPVAGCCLGAGACDDGIELSADLCHQNQCVHQYPGTVDACATSADCKGNACLTGTCVLPQAGSQTGGKCSYAKTGAAGCCTGDAGCAKDVKCKVDQCLALQCVQTPAVGTGVHVRHRFDTAALDGWTVKKDHPTVYFHFGTLAKVAGPGALRYGVPGVVSFESGNANKGSATSPVLTLPGAAAVRFQAYLDAEPGTAVHQCGLDVVDPATGAATNVWNKNKDLKGTTQQAWKLQQVSLAAWAGKPVQLRFWFDTVFYDSSNKQKLGFLVDELEIVGACP